MICIECGGSIKESDNYKKCNNCMRHYHIDCSCPIHSGSNYTFVNRNNQSSSIRGQTPRQRNRSTPPVQPEVTSRRRQTQSTSTSSRGNQITSSPSNQSDYSTSGGLNYGSYQGYPGYNQHYPRSSYSPLRSIWAYLPALLIASIFIAIVAAIIASNSFLSIQESETSSGAATDSREKVESSVDAIERPARLQMGEIVSRNAVLRSSHYTQSSPLISLSLGDRVTILDRWDIDNPDALVVISPTKLQSQAGEIPIREGSIVYYAADLGDIYIVSYILDDREITGEIAVEAVEDIGDESWYKVRTGGGKEGWISGKAIKLSKE